MVKPMPFCFLTLLALSFLSAPARAAKLVEVRTVDDEYVMACWQDGVVEYKDEGTGDNAFIGSSNGPEIVHRYDPALGTDAAAKPASYEITSATDPNYSAAVHPLAVARKAKVNGSDFTWPDPKYTLDHTLFLKLPKKLQQGGKYTLKFYAAINSDKATETFTFDIYSSVSEAVHVNLIGYDPNQKAMKSADLYMWLGDGGSRDYSAYVGKKVQLYRVDDKAKQDVGAVSFWKKSGSDFGNWNLIHTDVWNCDFSAATGNGTYRLVVEGVGCSLDFKLSKDIYYEPFKTALRGYYYMRLGEEKDWAITKHLPVPRQPRLIPDKDPAGFKVYLTTCDAWSKDKNNSVNWDSTDWSKHNEPGNPTNPNVVGGHADAGDWDRNCGHISIVYDLLLPYLMSNGKLGDDDCQIRESGNGVPDLIDEARNEVDFWLSARDTHGGYSAGLNNPDLKKKVIYQAAASPYMAWASAANAAMLADSYRVAGKADLAAKYVAAAQEAWKTANEQGLDMAFGVGNFSLTGHDLKAMAAVYLYNATGDTKYEDALAKEVAVAGPTSEIDKGSSNPIWAIAGYLQCAKYKIRPIHYAQLVENMKAAVLSEAMKKNVAPTTHRPSRRSSDEAHGWFPSTVEVRAACVAHAFAAEGADKDALLKALILEADYVQGRNPMNMVQMTGLGSRCIQYMYTGGGNDGVPGMHPGHTPYMNAQAWGTGFMNDPQWYASKGYPAWKDWPNGEAHWNVLHCFANSEYTPQQSFNGKMCLLAYLYSLGDSHTAP